VTVVVIDSGITPDHTEFGDRIVAMKNFNPSEADAIDGTGHGTHVAGTIAGRTIGVAPAADIAALRVFGPDNTGPMSAIIAALNWAANPFELPTPAVVNMSLGGTGLGLLNSIYFDALQAVQNRGIPIVASAGNYAYPAQWSMPANSAATVCVGATGIRDRPAVFSNNGPTVDIWAPGVNVLSADADHPDGGLKVDSGTSMSAPMTTGVLALHLQRHPPHASTQAAGGAVFDAVRRTLALIAAGAEGKLEDWNDAEVVAVGANGSLAGAANILLQACDADIAPGCADPLSWHDGAASIILGDGIDPLPPGFTCSRVVANPRAFVELNIQAPSLLPVVEEDGTISNVAADIVVTDLATGQTVWIASESWFRQEGYGRSLRRRLVASGPQGFRVDWTSVRDDLSGGYGYAMTATVAQLRFRPAGPGERGTVGGTELGQMLGAWGPCVAGAPCPSDLDGDGTTGASDLGLLLSVWGTIPVPVRPGFVLDCSGNQIPGSWLGDQYLDENGRSFWLNPLELEYPPSVVTADLNCDHLEWDAPRTGTHVSPIDPRIGASVNPNDVTCIETDVAGSISGVFFGHGTDCGQPGPTIDGASWCTGNISSGDPTNSSGNPDWDDTLVRQPLPAAVRRIDRITTIGQIVLHACSNSNIAPAQHQQLSPAFTGDLRITVSLDDGTTRSVIRSPEVGLALFSKIPVIFFYFSAEDIHEDDGRDVESICLAMFSPEPGLSMDRILKMVTSSLADDDPTPGAEYSPDNGRTWYPLLDSEERRLQVVLCIEGE
jgi:subtilisin family serine protease